MWIRLGKNPRHYIHPLRNHIDFAEDCVKVRVPAKELTQNAFKHLGENGLVEEEDGETKHSLFGKIMSQNCIAYQTVSSPWAS